MCEKYLLRAYPKKIHLLAKKNMSLSLIAAMSLNRVIGKGNQLPRHYSDDLKRFKRLTSGHTIVMGRKTFDSIGRPLPKRKNIVLTRNKEWEHEDVVVYHDIQTYLSTEAADSAEEEIFVIGGEQIYSAFLPYVDTVHLTLIKKQVEGDTYFPIFEDDFVESEREVHDAFDFITYKRKQKSEQAKREG